MLEQATFSLLFSHQWKRRHDLKELYKPIIGWFTPKQKFFLLFFKADKPNGNSKVIPFVILSILCMQFGK